MSKALSSSNQKTTAKRPLQILIEEAANKAANKVRERNKRMGWPIITSPSPAEESNRSGD